MILTVDSASAVPPYEQLRQQVITMVASGVLRDGDRLPSIRQLSRDLGIAAGTVNRAIHELENEGWLETRGHRGTFIVERAQPKTTEERDVELRAEAETFAFNARRLGASDREAVQALERALREVDQRP